MNKNTDTFATSLYNKFRTVNCTSYLVDQGIAIVSSILIAQCVSSEALAAVSVVNPLYCIVLFLTIIIAEATANKVQLELGRFKKERAGCALIVGLQFAIVSGILILAFFLLGKETYFRFMNVSESTAEYAREYLKFYQISFALYPLNVTMEYFISYSANIKLMYAKRGVSLIGSTVLALVFTKWLGIAGIGFASLITNITNICLMNTHFKSDYLSVKPKWMKMELGYLSALKSAMAGGTEQLVLALSGVIVNKIIINKFGESADAYLSILSILESVLVLECIYTALVQTARAQLDIYSVEGNYKTSNVLIKCALRDSLIAAIILFAIYELGAPLVPSIFNISDPELSEMCIFAVRITAIGTFFYGFYINYRFIHQAFRHYLLAALVIILDQLLIYAILMFVCTNLFGATGIWIAYALNSIVTVLIIVLGTWIYTLIRKDRTFPWLMEKEKPQPEVYNIVLTKENLMTTRDAAAELMEKAGVDTRTRYQMALVIEEFGMLVAEKNNAGIEDVKTAGISAPEKKPKPVKTEWNLWVNEKDVTLIVRDDGKTLDFSDEDNSTGSLGAYFLSCLMPNIGQVNYATAVSMNRHRFQILRSYQQS